MPIGESADRGTRVFAAVPSHVRIRILLAVAITAICASVFLVLDVQRRGDDASFAAYSSVRELRGTTATMAFAVGTAAERRAAAGVEVAEAQGELGDAIDRARSELSDDGAVVKDLFEQEAAAAIQLSELGTRALGDAPVASVVRRRDELLNRGITANDELLRVLAAKRADHVTAASRRPVLVVLGLSVLFGLMHLMLVERPARRERRDHEAQLDFADAMQVARSEGEAYDLVARHVRRTTGAAHVTVLNRNNSADRLEAATPVAPGSAAARSLQGAKPDSCLAMRLGRTHHVEPGAKPLLSCEVCGKSAKQATCVPSLVGGEVVGAVLVEHEEGLDRRSREQFEQSVHEAAPVIANLRNLAVAEIRAATDGLTGLPNQRAAHEMIKRAAALAGRTMSSLALVLFDLDRFKSINDTHGHDKGDEVLAAVAAATSDTLRESDFVGRLGGEEFIAVLPATDRDGAVKAAENLRVAIAAIDVAGVTQPISASFGVAVMPDDAGEPSVLLRQADRALYAAKNAGRNRVEAAAPAESRPDVGPSRPDDQPPL